MLWQSGRTLYRIVAPTDMDISLQAVIADFSQLLQQMSGVAFEIIADDHTSADHEIIVGHRNARLHEMGLSHLTDELGKDGYVIQTIGRKLIIAGTPPRGTINGIYGFLQDHLGCRWLTPGTQHVPRRNEQPLPDLNDRQTPSFEIRATNYAQHYDANWTVRNRINRCFAEFGDAAWHMLMDDDRAKTLLNYFRPHSIEWIPAERFGQGRDFMALVNRQREWPDDVTARALCLSSEGVERFVADILLEEATHHRQQGWTPQIFVDLSFSDSAAICQCNACSASIAEKGLPAHHLQFINRVAAIVAEQAPDTLISTLAYGLTFPPNDVKLRDNVIVSWCPINACVLHELDGCEPNRRPSLRLADLDRWRGNCRNMQVWYYNYQSECWLPHARLFAMQRNYSTFAQKGIIGIFTEAPPCHEGQRKHAASDGDGKLLSAFGIADEFGYFTCTIELHHLRAYVVSQLMWNVNLNITETIHDFCSIYYGPAGCELAEYALVVENPDSYSASRGSMFDTYADAHLDCGVVPFLKMESLQRMQDLVEMALQKTRHDPELHRRVQMVQASVDLYTATLTAPHSPGWGQARERCIGLMKELGIKRILQTPVSLDAITPRQLEEVLNDSHHLRIPRFEPFDRNVLRNSNFSAMSDGRPANWHMTGEFKPERYTLDPAGVRPASPFPGVNGKYLKLQKQSSPGKTVGIRQQFAVRYGQRYEASVRYISRMTQGFGRLILSGHDSRANWISNLAEISLEPNNGTEWIKSSVVTTIPAGIGRIWFTVIFYDDTSAGEILLDGASCIMLE